MYTLRCKVEGCGYTWDSQTVDKVCPQCEERRLLKGSRRYFYKMRDKDAAERRAGRAVSDREQCCPNCEKPLRGYCSYGIDDATGQQYLQCECGEEIPIYDKERV